MSYTVSPFIFDAHMPRTVFGAGSIGKLQEEVERLGARKALIIGTPSQRAAIERVAAILRDNCVGVYDKVVMHVPIESAQEVRNRAASLGADSVITIGGGSTTGLGKAVALVSSLPILAVPTTYAGSEMTPIYGITQGGQKITGRDRKVLPRTVIYDPDLSMSLPLALSVTSGLNAVAHAAEGLYAADRNPVMSGLAEEGIRAFANALPELVADPQSRDARAAALYGTWLCGIVLGNVGVALHHKLCHVLGGSYRLPHAETHAIVLPHALAYNAAGAPEAMARIASALGRQEAARGMYDFAKWLGAPTALKELGMKEGDLDECVALVTSNAYPNPVPLEKGRLRALLENAYWGHPPQS